MNPPPSLLVYREAVCLRSLLSRSIASYGSIGACGRLSRRSRSRSWRVTRAQGSFPENGAAGSGEKIRFEVDRDKAREALQKLDQQLESLSQQEALPKKRPAPPAFEDNLDRDMMMGMRMRNEEMPELSDSFLGYTAVALLLLTIVNNILFNVFVKPSVDGTEQVVKIERVPLTDPTEQLVLQSVD